MEQSYSNYFADSRTIGSIKEGSTITNMCFNPTGEFFTYTTPTHLKIHTSTGNLKNIITVPVEKMQFFHRNTLLHSKGSMIYYLSIYDNKYLRVFDTGEPVGAIDTDPDNDMFMTVGSRGSQIWDIRCATPVLRVEAPGHIGAIGNGRAVVMDNYFLRFYDHRSPRSPAATVQIPGSCYRKVWFTADGGRIMAAGASSYTVFDRSGESTGTIRMEREGTGFTTPDSASLVCSSEKYLFSYRLESLKRTGTLSLPFVSREMCVSPSDQYLACRGDDSVVLFSY